MGDCRESTLHLKPYITFVLKQLKNIPVNVGASSELGALLTAEVV